MPRNARFWRNVVLIALAHVALIAGMNPLERGSEGLIESRDHRVVGCRWRSVDERIGKNKNRQHLNSQLLRPNQENPNGMKPQTKSLQ